MQAIRIHQYGDESVLRLEEVRKPTPKSDEVLIQVRAAAINPFDTYIRRGTVEPDSGLPHIPGGDASGTVAEAGGEVTTFEVGDRVFTTGLGLDRPGSYAEYVAVPEHRVARIPEIVSFPDAAAAAETVTTGLQSIARSNLSIDDVCLVQGATGGVGHVTTQLAKEAGAFVVASCNADGAAAARRFGADAVVDYQADELAIEIQSVTDGRPVDVVVETHADANIAADIDVLGTGGTIVVLGENDEISIEKPTAGVAKTKQADLSFMSHMRATAHHGETLEMASRLLAAGVIDVEITSTFPLAEAGEAQRHGLQSGVVGKTVLSVGDTD